MRKPDARFFSKSQYLRVCWARLWETGWAAFEEDGFAEKDEDKRSRTG